MKESPKNKIGETISIIWRLVYVLLHKNSAVKACCPYYILWMIQKQKDKIESYYGQIKIYM